LELIWNWEDNNGSDVHDAENLLEGLHPHHTLKMLYVRGYQGVRFSSWLPSLTSLAKLKISQSMCQYLPPLYQPPSLRHLNLLDMTNLEYISDQEITALCFIGIIVSIVFLIPRVTHTRELP
jgi:hypothetical protein